MSFIKKNARFTVGAVRRAGAGSVSQRKELHIKCHLMPYTANKRGKFPDVPSTVPVLIVVLLGKPK